MKYIDAEKLISEIERQQRKLSVLSNTKKADIRRDYALQNGVYYSILSIIDSLQQEQPDADYEKDLTEWMKEGPHTCYPWCTIPDAIKITAEHFYELGRNARKNE